MNYLLPLFTIALLAVNSMGGELYDPFTQTENMKKKHSSSTLLLPPPPLPTKIFVPTVVTAVMNNKAFINNRWCNVNDSINGQVIVSIQPHFVSLKEGNRLIILGVGNQRRILGIKETQ